MAEINESWEPAEDPEVTGQGADVEQIETSKDARKMAVLCHLLGLVGFLGPLIVWLNEREKHHFVDMHGQEAMNYQISMMIYIAVAWVLCFVWIGFILGLLLLLVHIVLIGEAAAKASAGKPFRYFIAFRLLK